MHKKYVLHKMSEDDTFQGVDGWMDNRAIVNVNLAGFDIAKLIVKIDLQNEMSREIGDLAKSWHQVIIVGNRHHC